MPWSYFICQHPDCEERLLKKGLCKKHERERQKHYDQNRRKKPRSSTKRGYGASWQRIRAYKLKKDPLCECPECKANRWEVLANCVHHVDGDSKNNHPSNLMSMHKKHHEKLHAKDGERW